MKYFFILSLLILQGCVSAEMVRDVDDSHDEYAPADAATNKQGVVRYLNQGYYSVIQDRRKQAYRAAYESCAGKWKIVSEGPRGSGATMHVKTHQNMGFSQTDEYWYINFQCVD